MPSRKKKLIKEIDEVIEKIEAVYTPAPVEEEAAILCAHTNRHANPNLSCVLPKGHKGDHFNRSYWSDAAGTPVRKHA